MSEGDRFFHTSTSLDGFTKFTGSGSSLLTQSLGLEGGPQEGTEVGPRAGSGQVSG